MGSASFNGSLIAKTEPRPTSLVTFNEPPKSFARFAEIVIPKPVPAAPETLVPPTTSLSGEFDLGDGRWCLAVTEPGRYRVQAKSTSADYENWSAQRVIEVNEGDTPFEVRMVLHQESPTSQAVELSFLDASGTPVTGWSMIVGIEPPRDRLIQMSERGHRLAQGYELEFSRPSRPLIKSALSSSAPRSPNCVARRAASASIDVGERGTQELVLKSPGLGGRLLTAPPSSVDGHDGAYRTLTLTRNDEVLTFFGRRKGGRIHWSADSREEPWSATLLLPPRRW